MTDHKQLCPEYEHLPGSIRLTIMLCDLYFAPPKSFEQPEFENFVRELELQKRTNAQIIKVEFDTFFSSFNEKVYH